MCLKILNDANTTQCCAQPLCEHCYFNIKYFKNKVGLKTVCPGCRMSNWHSSPNKYLRKMVKTLRIKCPKYSNSSIKNDDLISYSNFCINSIPPTIVDLVVPNIVELVVKLVEELVFY